LRPIKAELARPYLKIKTQKKRAGDVTQVVGPGFNSQYHKRKSGVPVTLSALVEAATTSQNIWKPLG
jgi:hypothetical protein